MLNVAPVRHLQAVNLDSVGHARVGRWRLTWVGAIDAAGSCPQGDATTPGALPVAQSGA